ncbi:MAG TPA: VOC family protein [Dehalococcoidia bacterium]|nr:VOC family protein [Dehalococcoidia bacterium]
MAKVTHFEIEGPDGKKLQEFYTGLFGWTIDASNPMDYGIVSPVENGIGGGISASQDGKAHVRVYVEVDSVDPFLEKAKGMGGKVVTERTVLPGMVTFAQFEDPAGNVIGLAESDMPPA